MPRARRPFPWQASWGIDAPHVPIVLIFLLLPRVIMRLGPHASRSKLAFAAY